MSEAKSRGEVAELITQEREQLSADRDVTQVIVPTFIVEPGNSVWRDYSFYYVTCW